MILPPAARRTLPHVLPLAVLAVFVVVRVTADRFPAADGPHLLGQALALGNGFLRGEWVDTGVGILRLHKPHPPVGYLPTLILGPLLPLRWTVALASAFALWLCLDGLRRLVAPAPAWTAQVAWLLACGSALTWWSADHYGFDLAAAAVTLQALSWLHASDGFRRRRASVLFGAWLGAGFLTKYSVPLACALPVLAIALPALARRPLGVIAAFGAFLLVAGPWLAFTGPDAWAYVASALHPPAAPGNYPAPLEIGARFAGEGQWLMLGALKDALGWPGIVALVAGAVLARRSVPLLGIASGVVLLGAMNSREGRYVLPLVFLAAAAAAPALRWTRAWALGLALIALPPLVLSARAYATAPADRTPTNRRLVHGAASFRAWGAWPGPETAFRPISEHPGPWRVEEVLDAIAARPEAPDGVALVLSQPTDAPDDSTYRLLAEVRRLPVPFLVEHVRMSGRGLMEAREGGGRLSPRLAWVVVQAAGRAPGGDPGEAWLAAHPHEILLALALPLEAEGRLVALRQTLP